MTVTATAGTGLDTIRDLRMVIEDAVASDPRTLQRDLGPSELGVGCDRCLAHLLAGHDPVETGMPWLPTIGNAVHDWLEVTVIRHLAASGSDRYIPEGRVTVGQLRGRDITGHSDLLDVHTGTVVDYKVVGATTLRKVSSGPSITYRRQAHLYGRGWVAAGYDIRHVAIWYLPRNAMRIDAGHIWTEPYDEQVAVDALARANALAAGVDLFGVDAVLAQCPPHTGGEFTCTSWPTDPAAAPAAAATTAADFLGVA